MIKTVLIDGGFPVSLGDEEARFIYNLLPVGKFYDKRYGLVDVSAEKILKMAENFGKYPSYEVPVKLGHEQGAKSPGKVIGAAAKPDGLEITMLVDTDTAQAINNKQYRYMSAEFDENYCDKTTGEYVGPVLMGAALVNQPANPYMEPLKLAEEIEGGNYDMSEVEDLRLKLSDIQEQLRQNKQDNEKKLAELEAENKKLKAEREKAEALKNEAEVKSFCEKWTSNGIPPVIIEKVKPLLLGEKSRTIKLSDNPEDERSSLKFFDELFEGLPKVAMTQISSTETPKIELSDVELARERAKAIASRVR